jgi:hypothetical protein
MTTKACVLRLRPKTPAGNWILLAINAVFLILMAWNLLDDYRFAGIENLLNGAPLPQKPPFRVAVFAQYFPLKLLIAICSIPFSRTYLFFGFVVAYVVMFFYVFSAST